MVRRRAGMELRNGLVAIFAASGALAELPAAGFAASGDGAGYEVIQVLDGGKVSGRVTVTGRVPAPEEIEVNRDTAVCGGNQKTETYLVHGSGALANVVIWLDDVPRGKAWSRKDAEVEQKECRYSPHVQGIAVGGRLDVVNSDDVLHNIHAYANGETLFNLAQPTRNQRTPKKINRSGPVELKCDVHSWMHGWVFAAQHPYYAITGADGTFAIDEVPAGTYRLKAWHEGAGTKEVAAKVEPRGETKVDLVFEVK